MDLTTGSGTRSPRRRRWVAWGGLPLILAAGLGWFALTAELGEAGQAPRSELGGATKGATALAFSNDGRTLAFGSPGTVGLWDIAAGRQRPGIPLVIASGGEIFLLAFTPDDASLIAGLSDGTAVPPLPAFAWKAWDVATGRERPAPAIEGLLRSLAPARDGRTIALSGVGVGVGVDGERLSVLDAVTLQMRTPFRLVGRQISASAFSPDGSTLAIGHLDGSVTLLDLATGREGRALKRGRRWLTHLAFSPDGRTLAAGHDDGSATVDLWDLPALRLRHTVTGPRSDKTFQMAFSPDGRILATTFAEAAPALSRLARSVRWFVPPRVLYALGADRRGRSSIFLWDVAKGARLATLAARPEWLTTIAFSPDGRALAAASHDAGVLLWDTPLPVPSRLPPVGP
jgi:WD40 repeat protein